MRKEKIEPGPGQESVWDYPRPPRVENSTKHIKVAFNDVVIAETRESKRVLETSSPPAYYIPPKDIKMGYLILNTKKNTVCEWKGLASYYDIKVGDDHAKNAGWFYPNPTAGYISIKNYVAFYPQKMDACYVDGELVMAQPGHYYGGWITKDIVDPFKDASGTEGW